MTVREYFENLASIRQASFTTAPEPGASFVIAMIALGVGIYGLSVSLRSGGAPEVKLLARVVIGFCGWGFIVFIAAMVIPGLLPWMIWGGAFAAIGAFLHNTTAMFAASRAQQETTAAKTQTLWDFTWRRAVLEAKEFLRLDIHDPMVRTLYGPLFARLSEIGRLHAADDDETLAILIEREMGEHLARHICPQLQAHFGACLVCAVELAREG